MLVTALFEINRSKYLYDIKILLIFESRVKSLFS